MTKSLNMFDERPPGDGWSAVAAAGRRRGKAAWDTIIEELNRNHQEEFASRYGLPAEWETVRDLVAADLASNTIRSMLASEFVESEQELRAAEERENQEAIAMAQEKLLEASYAITELMAAIAFVQQKMASIGESSIGGDDEMLGALTQVQAEVAALRLAIASGDTGRILASLTLKTAVGALAAQAIQEAENKVIDAKVGIIQEYYEERVRNARTQEELQDRLRDFYSATLGDKFTPDEIKNIAVTIANSELGWLAQGLDNPEAIKQLGEMVGKLGGVGGEAKTWANLSDEVRQRIVAAYEEHNELILNYYKNDEEIIALYNRMYMGSHAVGPDAFRNRNGVGTAIFSRAYENDLAIVYQLYAAGDAVGARARLVEAMRREADQSEQAFRKGTEEIGIAKEQIDAVIDLYRTGGLEGVQKKLEELGGNIYSRGEGGEGDAELYEALVAAAVVATDNAAIHLLQKLIAEGLEKAPELLEGVFDQNETGRDTTGKERLEALLKALDGSPESERLAEIIRDSSILNGLYCKLLDEASNPKDFLEALNTMGNDRKKLIETLQSDAPYEAATQAILAELSRSRDILADAQDIAGKDTELGRAVKKALSASGGVLTPALEGLIDRAMWRQAAADEQIGFAKELMNRSALTEVKAALKAYFEVTEGKTSPAFRRLVAEYRSACESDGGGGNITSAEFVARLQVLTETNGQDDNIATSGVEIDVKAFESATAEAAVRGNMAKRLVLENIRMAELQVYDDIVLYYQEVQGIDIRTDEGLAKIDLSHRPTSDEIPDFFRTQAGGGSSMQSEASAQDTIRLIEGRNVSARLSAMQAAAGRVQEHMAIAVKLMEVVRLYESDKENQDGLVFQRLYSQVGKNIREDYEEEIRALQSGGEDQNSEKYKQQAREIAERRDSALVKARVEFLADNKIIQGDDPFQMEIASKLMAMPKTELEALLSNLGGTVEQTRQGLLQLREQLSLGTAAKEAQDVWKDLQDAWKGLQDVLGLSGVEENAEEKKGAEKKTVQGHPANTNIGVCSMEALGKTLTAAGVTSQACEASAEGGNTVADAIAAANGQIASAANTDEVEAPTLTAQALDEQGTRGAERLSLTC